MNRRKNGILLEVPEAEATGETARIYEEIKTLCGVPMVALIYRHLATVPGALEWAWANARPALSDGGLQEYAWSLRLDLDSRIPDFPRPALRVAGVDGRDERRIVSVLNSYNRANPVNIFIVSYLKRRLARSGGAGIEPRSSQFRPPLPEDIPPIVALDQMNPSLIYLLTFLATHGGATDGGLLPSLYRHLAHWPGFLALAANSLAPNFDDITREAAKLNRAIESSVTAFTQESADPAVPLSTKENRQEIESVFERFSEKIPEMIVVGTLLRQAMPPQ